MHRHQDVPVVTFATGSREEKGFPRVVKRNVLTCTFSRGREMHPVSWDVIYCLSFSFFFLLFFFSETIKRLLYKWKYPENHGPRYRKKIEKARKIFNRRENSFYFHRIRNAFFQARRHFPTSEILMNYHIRKNVSKKLYSHFLMYAHYNG